MSPVSTAKIKTPRYMKWRDGRPRWELGGMGGKLARAHGWKSRDLKDETGAWLPLEPACRMADELNAALDAWRAGNHETDPSLTPCPQPAARGVFTISRLIADYLKSDDYRSKSKSARSAYKSWLGTVDEWLGPLTLSEVKPSDAKGLYERALDAYWWKEEQLTLGTRHKALHAAFKAGGRDRMDAARQRRHDFMESDAFDGNLPGQHSAHQATILGGTVWLWARTAKNITLPSPFARLGLSSPKGRVRFITNAELGHLIKTAEAQGKPELADALILAIHTCQRRSDLISMDWSVLKTGRFDVTQRKTGTHVSFKPSAILARRLAIIRARQQDTNLHPSTHVLTNTSTGRPFDNANQLTKQIRSLRDRAAKTMPSLADIILHDCRDTGITRLFIAGRTIAQVCQISGHSFSRAGTIQKSYLATRPEISDDAIDGLDDYLVSSGATY